MPPHVEARVLEAQEQLDTWVHEYNSERASHFTSEAEKVAEQNNAKKVALIDGHTLRT